MTINNKLVKNTISSLVLKITAILCGFCVPRLILQHYGSETNGLVNSITSFLSLITFLDFGVSAVLQSSLYEPLNKKDFFKINSIIKGANAFYKKIGLFLLIYLFSLIVFVPFLVESSFSNLFVTSLILVIGISLLAQFFLGIVYSTLLIADQKGYISYNIQILTLLVNTITCYILIKSNCSIQIVKLAASLVFFFKPLLLFYYAKKFYLFDIYDDVFPQPINHKLDGLAQHFNYVILNSSQIIILTLFSTLSDVSVFTVYNLVLLGVQNIMNVFYDSLKPYFGELWIRLENEQFTSKFLEMQWALSTLSTFLYSVTCCLILPFISVFTYGVNDTEYNLPDFSLLICISYMLISYRMPFNILMLAGSFFKETRKSYISSSVIQIVFSSIGAYFYGLIGVTFGMLISLIFQILLFSEFTHKILLDFEYKSYIKLLMTNTITFIAIFLVSHLFDSNVSNYFEWIELAILTSVSAFFITFALNIIFYPKQIKKIFKKYFLSAYNSTSNKLIN